MEYENFVFYGKWRTLIEGFDETTAKEILWQIMSFGTSDILSQINLITYRFPSNIINNYLFRLSHIFFRHLTYFAKIYKFPLKYTYFYNKLNTSYSI